MAMTIKDIAKLANVSPSSVSKILNNKDSFISEATKQRVLKIVKENSYTPNPFARSLVTNQSKTLGLIVPDILNPFFPELVRSCDDAAQKQGYNLILCNSDDVKEKEEHYIDFLAQKGVDGIILASGESYTDVKRLNRYSIPVVTIDKSIDSCQCHVGDVSSDNQQGAYLSTSYLIKRGHRKIVFLCGSKHFKGSIARYNGYCAALEEAGLAVDKNLVHFGEFFHSFGYQKITELLKVTEFTAICCMNDMLALGAMKALYEAKIRIPEDCAVIGFDDIFLSNLIEKPLSTVKRFTYEMGVKGTDLLLNAIKSNTKNFVREVFTPIIVTRETT